MCSAVRIILSSTKRPWARSKIDILPSSGGNRAAEVLWRPEQMFSVAPVHSGRSIGVEQRAECFWVIRRRIDSPAPLLASCAASRHLATAACIVPRHSAAGSRLHGRGEWLTILMPLHDMEAISVAGRAFVDGDRYGAATAWGPLPCCRVCCLRQPESALGYRCFVTKPLLRQSKACNLILESTIGAADAKLVCQQCLP